MALKLLKMGKKFTGSKWYMVGVDGKKYPVINQRVLERTSNLTAIPEKEIQGYMDYLCSYITGIAVPEYSVINIPYMGNLKPQYKKIKYLKWLEAIAVLMVISLRKVLLRGN